MCTLYIVDFNYLKLFQQEEKKAAEEAAEIARLRREIIHKANPVRKYKPLIIEPTKQLPTVPKSPSFATDERLRARAKSDSTMDISSTTFNQDEVE